MKKYKGIPREESIKIPVYGTEENLDTFVVCKYNMIKKCYEAMENEIYFSNEEAKARAKELNKDVPPVVIPNPQDMKHSLY